MVAEFISNSCPPVFNQNCILRCRRRIALDILTHAAMMSSLPALPLEPRVVAKTLTRTVTNKRKLEEVVMSDNITTNHPVPVIKMDLSLPHLDNSNNKQTENAYITIIPNFATPQVLKRTEMSILNSNLFRQYVVATQLEPRIHFLLHKKATNNFANRQPGYR